MYPFQYKSIFPIFCLSIMFHIFPLVSFKIQYYLKLSFSVAPEEGQSCLTKILSILCSRPVSLSFGFKSKSTKRKCHTQNNLRIFTMNIFSLKTAEQNCVEQSNFLTPVEGFLFQTEISGKIFCSCFNFTAVLFLFLSSPWGSVYRFLHVYDLQRLLLTLMQQNQTQIEIAMKTRKSKRLVIKSNWFETFTHKTNFTAQLTDPFFKTPGRHIFLIITIIIRCFGMFRNVFSFRFYRLSLYCKKTKFALFVKIHLT